MRIALIGLPQAGKKTLFRLLTGRALPAGRKPEESIEGRALIRDPRVDALAAICKPEKKTYAENQFVLCPDADTSGDARAWLDAARKCDLICLVVRAFDDANVFHPSGSVDARRDRLALESELILADAVLVETRLDRIAKDKRAKPNAADRLLEEPTLQKAMEALSAGRRLSDLPLSPQEFGAIRSLSLLTLLPVLVTYNVSESDANHDFGPGTFTVSARIEEEIAQITDPAEQAEYVASLGLGASGVDRMNAAAYDALGLMSFYTIGPDEVRAWTIRKGSAAPTAGGKVHTDIERGFIRVEAIKYNDLIAAGSERAAREAGRMLVKGKDYIIEDGDICHFLFNV